MENDKRFVCEMNIENGAYKMFDTQEQVYLFEDMDKKKIEELCSFFNVLENEDGVELIAEPVTLFSLIKRKLRSIFSKDKCD